MSSDGRAIPLVVLRSNDVCFTGVLRACGRAGIPCVPVVHTWEGAPPWCSEASRYFHDPVVVPNPADDPEGAVEVLVALGRDLLRRHGQRVMLVPTSDTNLLLVQSHFERLEPFYQQMGASDFARPRLDVLRKDSFATLLDAAGVEAPRTIACRGRDDIERAVAEVPYPCVYKPILKDYVQSFQQGHEMRKAIECADADALRAHLAREMDDGYELVVQEKIPFDRPEHESSCHVYADRTHRIRLASTSNKEGEYPKPYGSSTCSRLTWIPELLPLAEAVVRALRWRGLLGIEFMRDSRDGRWKVIEANGRPWLHVNLQCANGFNHLAMLHEDAYTGLPHAAETKTPTAELLANRPVLISLSHVLAGVDQEAPSREAAADRLEAWAGDLPGAPLFRYLDADDPQPGWQEMDDLERRYEVPVREVLARVPVFRPFTAAASSRPRDPQP